MTHSGGKPHTNIGDKGQRYEVTYFDPYSQTRKTFGWSDSTFGCQQMLLSIDLHPTMTDGKMKDRWA